MAFKSKTELGAGQTQDSDHNDQTLDADIDIAPQHIHAKTIVLLVAIVGVYFVQVVHLTGVGVLTQTITSITGGAERGFWLAKTVAITAGTLSPPISEAADLWGRKWFVVGFTACGAVGCLIASRANTFDQLIAGQAIGAFHAGSQCLIHAIASEIMPRKYRPIAQAATATAGGLGGSVGALLSGGLVRTNPMHWRYFFYILTGMYTAMIAIIIRLYNPPPRELQRALTQREKLAGLDWTGYALFVPGLVLFCFALTSSTGIYPWKSAKIIAPITIGAIMLIAFVIYEWRFTNEGMLHHAVFGYGRNFPIIFGLFFVEGLLFYATNSYYSYEIASVFGKPLFISGAYYSVGWAVLIVVTQLTGVYCAKTTTVRGPLVVAFLAFATYSQLSSPKELISIATGLVIGVRSVGGTVGLAIFSAIFSSTENDEVPKKVGKAVSSFAAFDPKDIPTLLAAITSEDPEAPTRIPGVTPKLLAAVGSALQHARIDSFRNIWIAAAALAAVAAIGSVFLINPKAEFTSSIDAPIETEEELQRATIIGKLSSKA